MKMCGGTGSAAAKAAAAGKQGNMEVGRKELMAAKKKRLSKPVEREKAIPPALSSLSSVPNKATARAIKEARARKGVVVCKDAEDMFKKLGI